MNAMDKETTAALLTSRRTIHVFKPEQPPRQLIKEAIDVARWAPNHRLTEPWHFYLLGKETAAAIVELNAQLVAKHQGQQQAEEKRARWSDIPGWLVVSCDNASDTIKNKEDYAACCCAVQNLSLYLWSAGVGCKWTTGAVTREAAFYDLLWLDPDLETVVGLLWYGYPAEIPPTARKSVPRIMVELP